MSLEAIAVTISAATLILVLWRNGTRMVVRLAVLETQVTNLIGSVQEVRATLSLGRAAPLSTRESEEES